MKYVRNTLGTIFSGAVGATVGYGCVEVLKRTQAYAFDQVDPTVLEKMAVVGIGLFGMGGAIVAAGAGAAAGDAIMDKNLSGEKAGILCAVVMACGLLGGVVCHAKNNPNQVMDGCYTEMVGKTPIVHCLK